MNTKKSSAKTHPLLLRRAHIMRKLCINEFHIKYFLFYLSFSESTIVCRLAAIHAGSAGTQAVLMTTQKTKASRNTHGLNSASMFKLNSPAVPTFWLLVKSHVRMPHTAM